MFVATLLIHAAMLGFMVFFVAVISPSALKALDMSSASKFLRYVFPRIFAFGFVVATAATFTAFLAPPSPARLISLTSALFFLVNWLVLTPKINTQRDLMLAGDAGAPAAQVAQPGARAAADADADVLQRGAPRARPRALGDLVL